MDENDLLEKFREILYKEADQVRHTDQDSLASTASNIDPTAPVKRTLSYYEKLKEKNPKIYLDRKTALQMDRDSQALGAAFFDSE